MLKDIFPKPEIKKQPKKKLTAQQEKRVRQVAVVMLILAVLWLVFAPRKGVVAVVYKRVQLSKAEERAKKIDQDNAGIQEQINRAKNDPAYLEDLARKQYKILQNNEYLYDFRKEDEKKK